MSPNVETYTVLRIIKFNLFPVPVRLHSDSGKFEFRRYLTIFVIFKNVVHSLEPGETPSYSASHKSLNYAQRSYISQTISKRFGAVAVRLRLIFQIAYVQYCTILTGVNIGERRL